MKHDDTLVKANPLRFCEQLYAVVVGLGLALAAEQVVDLSRSGVPVIWERVPLFVAFLSVAFPYAHGAVRYIDLAYVEKQLGTISHRRAIADVLLDGVRMWWIIAISFFVSRPVVFAYMLIFLLLSGTGRVLLARLTRSASRSELERNLDRVNAIMLLATVVIVSVAQLGFEGTTEESITRYGLFVAALIYPVAFYLTSFRYFFESDRR